VEYGEGNSLTKVLARFREDATVRGAFCSFRVSLDFAPRAMVDMAHTGIKEVPPKGAGHGLKGRNERSTRIERITTH
jgi:hypothetical protein